MIAQDKKSTNQNSGVRVDATNNNGQKDTYYGDCFGCDDENDRSVGNPKRKV
jgi:hypothetical protein